MERLGERVFCKVGAEAVYCAALPEQGLGVAIKMDDGNNARGVEVVMAAAFGLMGYGLMKFGFEPTPLLLGFVLGPLMEENLRRAMRYAQGDPIVFVERPLSAALLAVAVVLLIIVLLPAIRKKREDVFVE